MRTAGYANNYIHNRTTSVLQSFMSGFILRAATESDNEALIELERSCPQGTFLAISSERKDYFFRSHLYGNHHTIIVLSDDQVIAVLAATMKRLLVNSREAKGVFLYDLRVHPNYRKSLGGVIMVKAWNKLEKWAEEQDADFIYGYVKSDNLIMRGFFGRKKYSIAGKMIVVSRPVFKHAKTTHNFNGVKIPTPDTMFDFLSEHGSKQLFPYKFRDNYISDEMEESGLFSCFRIEHNGSSASAGLLRVSEVLATRVSRIPWYYRVAGAVTRALSGVVPLPSIPEAGGVIRYYHTFNHTAIGPEGMKLWKELMRHLNNLALEGNCQLLTSAFDENDRFLPIYRKGSINTIRYVIGYKALKEWLPENFTRFYPDIRDMD